MTSGRHPIPPAPLRDEALAAVFDSVVVPKYWGPFAKRLLDGLTGRIAPKARVLEVGCATGVLTLDLAKLASEGRVMAVEPRKALLDVARTKAADLTGRRIFFGSDAIERTGFAGEAFDAVVANLPFESAQDPDAVLGEMVRTVAPDGTLAFSVALADTWSIVLDLYAEVLELYEFPGAAGRLARARAAMPEAEAARGLLDALGFVEVTCDTWTFQLRFRNARDLFKDVLVAAGPLEGWARIAGDEPSWERALFHLREAMDTYFAGSEAIEVPVHGAVVMGRAPDRWGSAK